MLTCVKHYGYSAELTATAHFMRFSMAAVRARVEACQYNKDMNHKDMNHQAAIGRS